MEPLSAVLELKDCLLLHLRNRWDTSVDRFLQRTFFVAILNIIRKIQIVTLYYLVCDVHLYESVFVWTIHVS